MEIDEQPVRRRPGGRSAKVVAAVREAAEALISEAGPNDFTVADLAKRAHVNATSIYRRWGSLESVLLDVEAARLESVAPVPDTGSLRGDLLAYGRAAAENIARPGGLTFLQALINARDLSDEQRLAPLLYRAAQLQTMLDRGHDRGEPLLDYTVVVDCVLAPIYLRTITGRGLDDVDLHTFVERALTTQTSVP